MFVDDWTLAPEKYDYTKNLRPNQWVKGHLAETWEFTDPYTFVVHLRQGYAGKIFRQQTAVSLSPVMWRFISTGCLASAAATHNPVPVRR